MSPDFSSLLDILIAGGVLASIVMAGLWRIWRGIQHLLDLGHDTVERLNRINGKVADHDKELREQRDYLVWLMGQAGQALNPKREEK